MRIVFNAILKAILYTCCLYSGPVFASGLLVPWSADSSSAINNRPDTLDASAFVLAVTINSHQITCPFGGKADAVASGGTAPYSYLWSNGTTTQGLGNIYTPGTYSVTVTDAAGQTASASTLIAADPAGIMVTTQDVLIPCSSTNQFATLTEVVTGGVPPYSFSWTGPGNLMSTLPQPLVNTAGTYIVEVTDSQGCLAKAACNVTVHTTIDIAAIVVPELYPGVMDGSIALNVCGGNPPYTFSWSNGSTDEKLDNLSTGTYTLTLVDASGCVEVKSYTVASIETGAVITAFVSSIGFTYSECGQSCGNRITIVTTKSILGWSGPNGYTNSGDWDISGLCAGTYKVTIVDQVTKDTAWYTWTFYDLPNGPPISIKSSNPGYCNGVDAGSAGNCEKTCPHSIVTYRIDSSGINCGTVPGTFKWTVTGAESWHASATGSECTVVWGGPGAGTVSAQGSNGFYCYETTPRCVTIIEAPTAKLSSSPAADAGNVLHVCKGQAVYFHSQSLNADLSEWLFGDDFSKSTESDPQHTFLVPGTYKVKLVARSLCLCSDTTSLTVEVSDGIAPLVDCTSTICPGEQITYHTPGTCGIFNWSISPNGTVLAGGGILDDSITVRWNSGPDGIITLKPQNCTGNICPQPAQIRIPVLSDLAKIEGKTRVCPGSEEVYTITPFGSGTYFTWSTSANGMLTEGQGTNKVTVAWSAGTNPLGWVAVSYYNCFLGCTGRDTIQVKVLPPFGISGPLELCQGTGGSFQAKQVVPNGAGVSCQWTVFDPAGVATQYGPLPAFTAPPFVTPGNYLVKAVPSGAGLNNTCQDSAEWKIVVASRPSKPLGITGSGVFCPDKSMTYKATGYSSVNNLVWHVGNAAGQPAVLNGNPVTTSFAAGTPRWIAVAQVTADELGCVSDTARLDVHELSVFSFSGPTDICAGRNATYTAPVYESADYAWEIVPADAGVIKKGQGTNKIDVFWAKPGDNSVVLKICSHPATLAVRVWAPPMPAFVGPAGVCSGATALISTAVAYDTYFWKNVHGSFIGSGPKVSVGPGSYALQVTDQHGCSGTSTLEINAYPNPNVSLTTPDATGFCNNDRTVHMTVLVNADANLTYKWLRDGAPLGVQSSTYSTNQYGIYSVVATNQYGCTAISDPINIYEDCGGVVPPIPACPPGSVDFTIDPTPRCDSFQFHLIAGPTYQPGSVNWVFGSSGGAPLGNSNLENPTFKFPNGGHYLVLLTAALKNGAFCLVIDSVRVEGVAQFSARPACPGDSTIFKDATTFLPDGGGVSGWKWDFGDPSSGAANMSTVRNLGHTYATSGTYTVTLTITAVAGCTASSSQQVVIPAAPAVNFAPVAKSCTGNAISMSIPITPDITFVRWDFDDTMNGSAAQTEGASVFYKYQSPGIHLVKVTVKNVAGCQNTSSQPVEVIPNTHSGVIQPATSVICEGGSITLQAPAGGSAYIWSNNNWPFSSNSINQAGNYTVTVTYPDGCTYVPPVKTILVNPAPDGSIKALVHNDDGKVVGLSTSPVELCAGQGLDMIVASNGPYKFTWSNGSSGNEVVFSDDRHNLLLPGSYTYTVTITNTSTGCTSVTPPFNVIVHPVPGGFSVQADQVCAGTPNTVQYIGPQPPGWHLLWNNGQQGPSFVTTDPGHYFMRVVNEFGCAAESNTVTVHPGPNIAAIPGGCHQGCSPDTLCIPPMPDIVSWQWYLDGNPVPGATQPNLVAVASGTYYVTMVDTSGCKAQSGPLELDLYQGYGNIYGNVWSDVNGNGIVDAGDTLVRNIPVHLLNNNNIKKATQSGSGGKFAFSHVLSTDYAVSVDTVHLSPAWTIVIGRQATQLTGCNASSSVDLLLRHVQCQPLHTALDLNICPGSDALYNGVSIPAGQSKTFTFHTITECDSTVTVAVHALPVPATAFSTGVCPGTTFDYQGVHLTAGQMQSFTLLAASGCDSIVTVSVSGLPVSSGLLDVSVCAGSAYSYQGVDIPAGQSRLFTLQNSVGCDSVLTVTVHALPVLSGTIQATVCNGASYTYQGVQIPAGQSQSFTLQASTGCDSVVTVTVHGLPALSGTLDVDVCTGSSYTYQGVQIQPGDSKSFTLQAASGCDSVVTVSVHGLPVLSGALDVDVCAGSSFTYQGVQIQPGNSKSFKLQATSGCDSVVTVSVHGLPVLSGAFDVDVCTGSSYTYQGVQIHPGNSKSFTLQASSGCDSIVTVTVHGLPVLSGMLDVQVCAGSSYTYQGVQIPAGQSQSFTLQSPAGCDSVVTVTVHGLPAFSGTLDVHVCAGSTYTYQGMQIQPGNSKSFTLQAASGCDSVVTVSVYALPVLSGVLDVQVCAGSSYTYQGIQIPAGQSQTFTLQTAAGCDSLVTVTVHGLPALSGVEQVSACSGSAYLYQGVPIPAGQSQSFTLQSFQGCDSVVTVTVQTLPLGSSTVHGGACLGTSFDYYGTPVPAGGTRQFTLQNIAGCDSVVTVVVETYAVDSTGSEVFVCLGVPYTYNGQELLPGAYIFHYKGQEGCDSMVTVKVVAYPDLKFTVQSSYSCASKPNGDLLVDHQSGGTPPYRYSLDGVNFQTGKQFDGLASGAYTLYIADGHNCIFKQMAEVEAYPPLVVRLPDAVLSCDSPSVRLIPELIGNIADLTYKWWNGSQALETEATDAGKVWVEISDVCETVRREATVNWGGLPAGYSYVYVPNTFAPESDNYDNTGFRPYFADNLVLGHYLFEIYDRWGNLMFRSERPEIAWDAVFRARVMDPGVYVWRLEAGFAYCGRPVDLKLKGDVTVVR